MVFINDLFGTLGENIVFNFNKDNESGLSYLEICFRDKK